MKKEKLAAFLKNIFQPENLINLLGVFVAIILGYRSIQTGKIDEYLQALLVVLGVLALAQLVAGYSSAQRDATIKQLAETVKTLEQSTSARTNAANFFSHRADFPSTESTLEGVKQFDAVGVSLIGLAVTHSGLLKAKLESGCRMRFIATNPVNNFLSDLVVQRFLEAQNRELHISHVTTSINSLSLLSTSNSFGGSVEVRLMDNLPPFGMLLMDSNLPSGKIRVELYPEACPIGQRPVFELWASRDGEWYHFFKQQFETLWEKAVVPKA